MPRWHVGVGAPSLTRLTAAGKRPLNHSEPFTICSVGGFHLSCLVRTTRQAAANPPWVAVFHCSVAIGSVMRSLNAKFLRFRRWAAASVSCLPSRVAILAALLLSAQVELAAAAEGDYQLAPGDVVEFDFLDDEDLPRQLMIATDGQVQVPLLGGVDVAGRSVAEALAEIRKQFRDNNLLLDPKVTLSVAIYRPIYVIGDVKTPGSFPFQALMTVEKAIGVAGGPMTMAGDVEDRVIGRSRVAGELEIIGAELAREAVAIAQATAQLSERTTIEDGDVPESTRPYLDAALFKSLKEVANASSTSSTRRSIRRDRCCPRRLSRRDTRRRSRGAGQEPEVDHSGQPGTDQAYRGAVQEGSDPRQ